MTDQDTGALAIDQLTELRIHAKLLWESGILEPHEKQHLWKVLMRIDQKVKEIREQEDAKDGKAETSPVTGGANGTWRAITPQAKARGTDHSRLMILLGRIRPLP